MFPPVAIGQVRVSKTDVTLAGRLLVPAGTLLWVPHLAIQNASFNWDQPNDFLPGAHLGNTMRACVKSMTVIPQEQSLDSSYWCTMQYLHEGACIKLLRVLIVHLSQSDGWWLG